MVKIIPFVTCAVYSYVVMVNGGNWDVYMAALFVIAALPSN